MSAVRAAIARADAGPDGTQAVLEEIKRARLLGRGGAGFTTGVKWESCRRQPTDQRVVVCNADEGEPGTFKDRLLLTQYADLIVEGMTVAALGIEARQGFIYLRGEYRYLLESINAVLARRRATACSATALPDERVSTSTSRCTSAPAPMSVARRPRWSSRSRASAAFRATDRHAWPRRATWGGRRS